MSARCTCRLLSGDGLNAQLQDSYSCERTFTRALLRALIGDSQLVFCSPTQVIQQCAVPCPSMGGDGDGGRGDGDGGGGGGVAGPGGEMMLGVPWNFV